jgi:YesN/AraC family two-component response regulator
LNQGDIIFHKPNEFHNIWANGRVAPNLIVLSFECKSSAISYFENKILSIGDYEKNLLAQIIREAKDAFVSPLNLPSLKNLERNSNSQFGCEQLIKIYLEQMLIHMIRKGTHVKKEVKLSSSVKERSEEDMLKKIKSYLEQNVRTNLSFDDVCRFSSLSRTYLKVLFKEKTAMSVMEYFRTLKIEEAKKLIREGNHNFTQIANELGYASIHYFSRHFKKVTDMTPTEYASSVKIKI